MTGLHAGADAATAGRPAGSVAKAAAGTTATPPTTAAVPALGWRSGLTYGALGLPLAFVALPLYVILPSHYAVAFGVPLAALGTLLLAARLADAVADPWIGRLVDRWLDVGGARPTWVAALAAVVLLGGLQGLFFPPPAAVREALLAWCAAMLLVTYLAYSVLGVLHQAWGARLGGDETRRARVVAWREALALAGVVVASVLPGLAGLRATGLALAALLAAALVLLARAPRPMPSPVVERDAPEAPLTAPLRVPAFRRLLAVYLLNGVAGAVPATLLLFFVRDRLQAPSFEPLFLSSYFVAAAVSMPLWLRVVARRGLARAWFAGMLLAVGTFAWATALGAGDVAGFVIVCIGSGVALGADLVLPGAMLAGLIQRNGHAGRLEGRYFGWWNFATKLNLALAAGLALPLLGAFGYAPGRRDDDALMALTLAYCVLPCALKCAAAALLHRVAIHPIERGAVR